MIEAKNLIIGDYIKCSTGITCTVVSIISDARYLDAEATVTVMDADGKWHDFNIYDIEPIPLTAEILEKNGFKLTELYKKYEWNERHSEVWVIMGDSNDSEKLNAIHIDDWQHRIPVCYHNTIQYVHELQNALRLCRINKEITL